MTETQNAGPAAAHTDWGSSLPAPATEQAPKRGPGRTAIAVTGTVAAVALAAGGAYAVTALRGGGAQPESALPAATMAFVKIDLDPSSGQKIDALRFARKFPGLTKQFGALGDDTDLRKLVVQQLQKSGQLKGIDYDKDIAPWIGKRVAVGVVPGPDAKAPVPVAVLAVTDRAKAQTALDKATKDGASGCTLTEEFALCGQTKAAMDTVRDQAAKGSLEKATTFSADMSALGEDGIATFWTDLSGFRDTVKTIAETSVGSNATSGLNAIKGRAYGALRFDGTSMEIAGGARDTGQDSSAPKGTDIGKLPADTMAAVAVNGAGPSFAKQWATLKSQLGSELDSSLNEMSGSTGLTVPDDIVKLLGNRLTVAFGGMADTTPKLAITTDGDAAVAQKFVTAMSNQGLTLTSKPVSGGTLLATDDAYAAAVANAGEGLGSSKTFAAAVPDAKDAYVTGYADIAGLLAAFGADLPADAKTNLAPMTAFGMSAKLVGKNGADFTMRLITK